MSDSVKSALKRLQDTLQNAADVDEETLALAQRLEADIQKKLDEEGERGEDIESSVDLAIALESRFESEHPVAAGLMREIINALHKMGI